MTRFWPVGVTMLVFGGLGVAGLIRPAGTRPADPAVVQARLDALPMTVGPWVGRTEPYPQRTLDQAEAMAAINRVYTRTSPPAAVSVLILAGSSGAMGAHDPSVCFAGAGYKAIGAAGRRPCGPDALWTARYDTAGGAAGTFQVNWGWSAGDRWAASDNPRLDYTGRGVVYKLYLTRGLPPGGGPKGQPDPTDEFLALFLPLTQPLAGTTPATHPE